MNSMKVVAAILALLFSAGAAEARSTRTSVRHPRASKCSNCVRDSKGHIARSSKARTEFRKSHPCPATGRTKGACPGYVIDHIVALKRGGPDRPSNMQWQTKAQAREKDRVE